RSGTSATVTAIWDALYKGVNQCNTVIARVATVPGLSEDKKLRIEGEARFLRALYYYHIVQQWGGVHFSLEETQGVETEANRTPEEVFYNRSEERRVGTEGIYRRYRRS